MKKYKAVSLLLCASMVMSMTGCSGAKKKILEAADEYAQAVISSDIGDIAEFMKDDDDFEEEMELFMESFTSNEDLEDIYEFILDNTTYEIDKKSLTVTDKNKKASLEITYTMIDYMDVYEDLDDDADVEDFLDELEDNTDNTMKIDQKVEFRLVKDEWKIVDKNNEGLLEVYEFYSEIYDLGWGGTVGELTMEAFQAACADVLGDNDPYFFDGTNFDDCTGYGGGVWADLEVETDSRWVISDFEYYYEEYQDMIADGNFEGTSSAFYDGETGYILLDGYGSDSTPVIFSGEVHCGVFYSGTSLMTVNCSSCTDANEAMADEFMTAMGCPTL